jgi:hypothetical protein
MVAAIDTLYLNFILWITYFVSTLRTSYFVLTLHTLSRHFELGTSDYVLCESSVVDMSYFVNLVLWI